MGFSPLAGRRYDMPALFGPSPIPDNTIVENARSIVLSVPISASSAETLLPDHFGAPDSPVLSVAYVQYDSVDYLGGRGYNEIVVTVSAIHEGPDRVIAAAYAPVLWVNKIGALISGREYMGLPKLFGIIPKCDDTDDGYEFRCLEEDALLLQGSASQLAPITGTSLDKLNARTTQVRTFGWKYIPGPEGNSDIDYPLVNVMRWNYHEAATGRGQLSFSDVDRREAPMSAGALEVLRSIEPEGEMRAFYGRGVATIDRRATTRLAVAGAAPVETGVCQ